MAIGAVAGMVFSLLLAVASVSLKADQTIGGTALNLFAPAFAIVLTWAIQGQGQTTINIPTWIKITRETLGLAPSSDPGFWDALLFKSSYLIHAHCPVDSGFDGLRHLQDTIWFASESLR